MHLEALLRRLLEPHTITTIKDDGQIFLVFYADILMIHALYNRHPYVHGTTSSSLLPLVPMTRYFQATCMSYCDCAWRVVPNSPGLFFSCNKVPQYPIPHAYWKSFAPLCMRRPIISPNSPRIAAKISMVRILTNLKSVSTRTVQGLPLLTMKGRRRQPKLHYFR
jgi:hypothetical protein